RLPRRHPRGARGLRARTRLARLALAGAPRALTPLLQWPLNVLFAVEAQERRLLLDLRVDLHRTTPQTHHRLEHLARPVDTEIDALMIVREQQLAAIAEVGVLHVDERLPRVRELEEQLVLHLGELAALDLE